MAKRPDLSTTIKRLKTVTSWLEAAGAATLLAAEPVSPRGDGPRPEISRPTEAAAVAHLSGDRDWLEPQQQTLLALIAELDRAAVAAVNLMSDIHARLPRGVEPCRRGCGRPASPGRQGQCDACRMRLRRSSQDSEPDRRWDVV